MNEHTVLLILDPNLALASRQNKRIAPPVTRLQYRYPNVILSSSPNPGEPKAAAITPAYHTKTVDRQTPHADIPRILKIAGLNQINQIHICSFSADIKLIHTATYLAMHPIPDADVIFIDNLIASTNEPHHTRAAAIVLANILGAQTLQPAHAIAPPVNGDLTCPAQDQNVKNPRTDRLNLHLTPEAAQALDDELLNATHPGHTARRALALLLLHEGNSQLAAARNSGLNEHTVANVRRNAHKNGWQKAILHQPTEYHDTKFNPETHQALQDLIAQPPTNDKPRWSGTELARAMVALGIVDTIQPQTVRTHLRRYGYDRSSPYAPNLSPEPPPAFRS